MGLFAGHAQASVFITAPFAPVLILGSATTPQNTDGRGRAQRVPPAKQNPNPAAKPPKPPSPSSGAGIFDALPNNSAFFPDLATSAPMKTLGGLAMLFGGVFLLWGHAARMDGITKRGSAAGDDLMREQVRTYMTLAAMIMSPYLLGSLATVADSALAESVRTPAQINKQVALALNMLPDPGVLVSAGMEPMGPKISDDGLVDDSEVAWYSKAWNWVKDAADTTVGWVKSLGVALGKVLEYGIKTLVVYLLYAVCFLHLLVAQLAIWIVEQIRFLILVIGGVLLPLFVSAYGLNDGHFFKQSGTKLTLSLMCVALWPFAWIVFGLLTGAFVAAWAKALVGVGIWNNSQATLMAMDRLSSAQSSAAMGALHDNLAASEAVIGTVIMNGLGPILAMTVGTVGLGLWMIIAPFKLPFMMQDMILTGADKITEGALSGAKMVGTAAAVVTGGAVAAAGAAKASAAMGEAMKSGGSAGSGLSGGKMFQAAGQMLSQMALGNKGEAAGSLGRAMDAASVYRRRRQEENTAKK